MFHLAEAEEAARFTWTAPATLRSLQHESDLEAGGGGGRFAEVDVHVVPGRGPADGRVGGPGQGSDNQFIA